MTSIPNPRAARVEGEHPPLLTVAPMLRTSAGVGVDLTVGVTNQAPVARAVNLQALGLDPAWLPAPYTTPVLAPGETHTVIFTVSPPAGTLPAQYPFVVTAQSVDAAGAPTAKPALAETAVLVNPRAQLRLELVPSSVTAWRRRRMSLRLINTGAGTASVRLQPQSTGSVRLRLSQKAVDVPAGATITVPGRVKVLHPQLVGFRMRHIVRVEATGSETAKYAEGEVVQRPMLPPVWIKAVAIVAALAVWVSAGLVLLPRITHLFGSDNTATVAGPAGNGTDGGADGADGGAGGSSTSEGGTKSKVVKAAKIPGVQLNGTISADAPGGVTVHLRRTSLVDEEALGATSVRGATAAMSTSLGKLRPVSTTTAARSRAALARSAAAAASAKAATGSVEQASVRTAMRKAAKTTTSSSSAIREVVTGSDGVWSFPGVEAPGFYLLTFDKAGFEPRSYVVDSSSETADQPIPVDLAPGDGTISGTITGSKKALGGATVTVTDGVSTLTTHTLSTGKVGSFSLKDLATPGTYVVSATRDGLSLESKVVTLSAGGSSRVDLNLRTGVATLTGRITDGSDPIGGATVTVTDETGRAYTSTSETPSVASTAALKNSTAGTYHVPGLPSPGRYSVTVTAEGFQPLSTTLTLTAGQSSRSRNLDLISSTGTVIGQVTDTATPAAGLSDAGLVLTNSEHTYKQASTTSVSGGITTEGFVEFDGVAPGTYQLSTQLWGYTPATTTVIVTAGEATTIAPRLTYRPVSEITASGYISGSAINAATRGAIECPTGTTQCLTATTTDPCPDDQPGCANGADAAVYSVNFGPGAGFTLPAAPDGLRPGLHTVTISAPGYESVTTRVAVPANATAAMPVTALYPAPTISGTISIGDGSAISGSVCVYAVSTGTTAPTTCVTAPGTPTCPTATSTRVCTLANAMGGGYTLQVPEHGSWTIYVIATNPDYVASTPTTLVIDLGGSRVQNATLNRLGRATVNLKISGANSAAVSAAEGSELTVTDDATGTAVTYEADTHGSITIPRMANGTYTLAASDADTPTLTGTRSLTVTFNTNQTVTVMLLEALPSLVGRVTSTLETGEVKTVSSAQVSVTAPYQYDANDNPLNHAIWFTTGDDGCFGGLNGPITQSPADIDAGLPIPSGCDGSTAWSARGAAAAKRIDFLTTTTPSVKVTASGYADRTYTSMTWAASPTELTLEAKRITWPGLTLTLPTSTVPSGLVMSVEGLPGGGQPAVPMGDITLTPGTAMGSTLPIVWKDGVQGENSFGPGHYRLTAKAPGYSASSATLNCEVGASACALDGSGWNLTKLGSVEVSVVGASASGLNSIEGAAVTVQACTDATCTTTVGDPYQGTTNGNGKVTIAGSIAHEGLTTPGYNGGTQWFKVSLTATSYEAPASQIAALSQPGDDASLSFTLDYPLAKMSITVLDQGGRAITFANVDLIGPSSTITLQKDPDNPGVYLLPADPAHPGETIPAGVKPGTYSVRVTAPQLTLTADYGLTVSPGALSAAHTIYVTRGASRIFGTVATTYTPAGATTALPLDGATVTLTCNPAVTPYDASLCPDDGPALGTDGAPLTTTTAANGYYDFDNVPNGSYKVNASATGWVGTSTPPVSVAWNLATPLSQDFSLAPVTQAVTITLDASSPDQTLSDFRATVTPVSTAFGQKSESNIALGLDGTTTLPHLQWGCYTVTFSKPTGHYGTAVFGSQTSGGIGAGCAELGVSKTPTTPGDDHTAAVTYTLDEAPLTTTVVAGAHWHDAPTNAKLSLVHSGTTVVDELPVGASGTGVPTALWVPSGTWTVKAAAAANGPGYSYPATFWPAQSDDVAVDDFSGGETTLTLAESRAVITIKVPNGGNATGLTITPTGSDAPRLVASPATNELTGTTTGGEWQVTLPGGTYDVAVSPPTGWVTPATQSLTVSSTASSTKTLDALVKATYSVEVRPAAAATGLAAWKIKLTPVGGGSSFGPTNLAADGTLTIPSVPWGCYQVSFTAPGGSETRTIAVDETTGPSCSGTGLVYLSRTATSPSISYTVTTPPPPEPPDPTDPEDPTDPAGS
jgi:large repetitive protein